MRNKIATAAVCLLCGTLLLAQTPANRTTQTILADALAQMPATDQASYNQYMNDLLSTGPEGIQALIKQLPTANQAPNAAVEYALSGIGHWATAPGNEAYRTTLEAALLQALQEAEQPETKAFFIRQLQIVGTQACVETLASYLNHEAVSGPAARALVALQTPNAGQALQTSLLKRMGTPRTQQDAIQAIGEAQYPINEELLTPYLAADNENLRKVTAYALSRIGTKASLPNLEQAAQKVAYQTENTAVTYHYIQLIRRVHTQGDTQIAQTAAANLHKKASQNGYETTRVAAIQLGVELQGAKATKTLLNALKDPSANYRNTALAAASGFADQSLYLVLLKSLPKANNQTKTDILNWIGREAQCPQKQTVLSGLEINLETTAQQLIIKQLNSTDPTVKLAAATALVRIGNPQALPALAAQLNSTNPQVVAGIQQALETFKGNIAQPVARVLPTASEPGKIAAMQLLALRKATPHLNDILEQAKTGTPGIQQAAYLALKDVVGEKDFTNMCGMLETAPTQTQNPLQQAVVATLATQTPQQQVETLSRRMVQAGDTQKHLYYLPLSATAQPQALQMLVQAFNSNQGPARQAAFEALLHFKTLQAAPELYAIAQANTTTNYFECLAQVKKPVFAG